MTHSISDTSSDVLSRRHCSGVSWGAIASVIVGLTIPSILASAQEQPAATARIEGQAVLEASVGMMASIQQVVIPGSELIARRTDPRTAVVVVRIDAVYPHANGFRYDLTWSANEPGQHDLRDYLARKDGTPTDDLPPLTVTATSVLPPERISPNAPEPGMTTSLGGYRTFLWIAVVLWIVGLAAILVTGRNQSGEEGHQTADSSRTRLEAIRQLLENAAADNKFAAADKARLEGMIIGFWRDYRQIGDLSAQSAVRQLQDDPEAGPLLRQLERWLYDRPQYSPAEVALFLSPMQAMVEQTEASKREPVT